MEFNAILDILQSKGISQRKFAMMLGIGAQKVSDWKKGTVRSWEKRLPEIAAALDVSLDELVGNEKQPATSNGDRLSNDEERFILWYRSLSADERSALKIMYKIE